MKNRKILIITGVIIALIVLLITAVGKKGAGSQAVKTAEVIKGDLKSYMSTNAVIQSKNTKNYTGASQLIVKSINVKVGDNVKKGQVMLQYDISDLNASAAQARLQYSNAVLQRNDLIGQKKQLDDAIYKLDREIKELESSNNPADMIELQTLRQKREALQPVSDDKIKLMDNSVSIAKLALDSANERLDKYKGGIVAESDGVVTALNAAEGAVLSPAQPAIVVMQLDSLKASMSLGKYDALKVGVGQEAVLKNGGKSYKGIVSFINPAAEKSVSTSGQTTTLNAEIDILDPGPELKVDFDVNVDILLGSVQDALKIPVESVKYDKDGKSYVFKIVDGTAKQVEVKLGLQSDTEVQVIDGLLMGDTVILNPGISMKDGTVVKTNEGERQ